ncbi:hypothetical protein SAMN04487852_11369 [Prevotella sp. tf2-5]|nr:hypothetical protein SAMN04487852_11369 [Prevotella sp. tf2-5]
MEFITVTSLGGSTWSFRKDRIEMVINRFTFTEEESKNIPEAKNLDSCAIIRLIGDNREYFCKDSYESIMKMLC